MNFDIKQFFPMIDSLSAEKMIPPEKITTIVQDGIAIAIEREITNNSKFDEFAKNLRGFINVIIDKDEKQILIYRKHYIVSQEDYSCPEFQVTPEQIKSIELQIEQQNRVNKNNGQRSHYEIDAENGFLIKKIDCLFSRQQFNAAKQYIKDKINREFAIIKIESLLEDGENLFKGTVNNIKKDFYMVSLENIEIKIPKPYLINNESFNLGDKITFSIIKGNEEKKGTLFYDNQHHHAYLGTRNSVVYLESVLKKELFHNTNNEIVYSIRANNTNKIIVKNPIPSNLNLSRALEKLAKEYLNRENVDIIPFNNDPVQLLIKIISPVQTLKIIKEDNKLNLIIGSHDISKIILKNEHDINNIESIIGVQVAFYSTEEWKRKESMEKELCSYVFKKYLGIKDYIIKYFNSNELISLESIADVPEQAFIHLTSNILSKEKAINIHSIAINILQNKAIELNSIYEFSKLGLSTEEIEKLQQSSIYTLEDIAELSFFDLEDILPNVNENFGKKMILKARKKTNLI